MSHSKQITPKNNPYQNQYPSIKPSYMKKINNQQRLKQVYKSNTEKQKEKSKHKNNRKYYLPLTNKNHLNNQNTTNHQINSKDIQLSGNKNYYNNTRYKDYLQGEQMQKHYLQSPQQHLVSQRYNQPRTTRFNGQSQQKRKINVSSNLQVHSDFRRKVSSQLQNQNLTSRKRQSAQNLQNQLNEMNLNINRKTNLRNNSQSRYLGKLEDQEKFSSARYQNQINLYQQVGSYNKDAFKIRRSTNTKKSFSGSLSKNHEQDYSREDSRIGYNKVQSNGGTVVKNNNPAKSESTLLQQGKRLFKNGNLSEAISVFEKGKQQQPKNLQYSYNIALVYLKSHKYQQGLKILEQIIRINCKFKKVVYLFAVISLKHLNRLDKAIQMANEGLKVFGNSTNGVVDLLFYRGKLYKQMGSFDDSLKDMQTVLSIQKDHVEASYYTAYLYFQKQLITHAMSALSAAIFYDQNKFSSVKIQALKLRAKMYLSQGKIKQAKKDIQKVIQKSGNSTETYFLMGKISISQNNVNQGLISFEKCLRQKVKNDDKNSGKYFASDVNKNDSNSLLSLFQSVPAKQYLIPALLQICKIKIDSKDFYSAYHHIGRSKNIQNLDSDNNLSLLRFKYFIEGVVFLMKKKIDEGMINFQKFIQIQNTIKKKLESKSKMQKQMNKQGRNITDQIVHSDKQLQPQPQFNPTQLFDMAQLKKQLQYFYPGFYLYRAYGYFMQNKHDLAIRDYEQYQQSQLMDKYTTYNMLICMGINHIKIRQFDKSLDYLNKAQLIFVNTEAKKVEPFIYRALSMVQQARHYMQGSNHSGQRQLQELQFQNNNQNDINDTNNEIRVLQLVFDALKQLDKAYDINDSNSNLLFIRSLIYAYLSKFQQSLDDIIKGIGKSEENVPKYFFFRGLIQATMNNKKQAINDFNIAINLDGNYAQVYFERAKLYFQLQNYTKAFQDLSKYGQLKSDEDVQFHKAALYLVNGIYNMGEDCLLQIRDKDSLNFKEIQFHIFLKLGKLQQAQQALLNDSKHEYQTDRLLLKVLQNNGFQEEIFTKLDKETIIVNSQRMSTKKLKYFNAIEYYHLLGVAYFKIGQYERALEEFTIALKQCNLRDMESAGIGSKGSKRDTYNNINNNNDQQSLMNLGDRESNCIMYNVFLCHLQLKDIRKAYEIFIKEIMSVDQKLQKSQFMSNFSHLLFQAMKRSLVRKEQQQVREEDKEEAHVELFTNNMTEMYSEEIIIELATFSLKTRLSYINLQSEKFNKMYSGKLYPETVMDWLSVREVENRPQPPWVKRLSSASAYGSYSNGEQGLVFTDNVQNINIEFQTTQHDEEQEQGQSGGQQQEEANQQDQDEGNDSEEEQEEEDEQMRRERDDRYKNKDEEKQSEYDEEDRSSRMKRVFDPRKFRDQMKLGDSIERKLNKIVERKINPV